VGQKNIRKRNNFKPRNSSTIAIWRENQDNPIEKENYLENIFANKKNKCYSMETLGVRAICVRDSYCTLFVGKDSQQMKSVNHARELIKRTN
jgi:hypothetical protein